MEPEQSLSQPFARQSHSQAESTFAEGAVPGDHPFLLIHYEGRVGQEGDDVEQLLAGGAGCLMENLPWFQLSARDPEKTKCETARC